MRTKRNSDIRRKKNLKEMKRNKSYISIRKFQSNGKMSTSREKVDRQHSIDIDCELWIVEVDWVHKKIYINWKSLMQLTFIMESSHVILSAVNL